MSRLNLKNWRSWFAEHRTHEGGPAKTITPELELRRSVLACMLWEKQFYEDGVEIAGRIAELVPKVEAGQGCRPRDRGARDDRSCVTRRCIWCGRWRGTRRTGLSWVRRWRTRHPARRRADRVPCHLLEGRKVPLSAQVKKGLARAFGKFDAYELAKYDRPGAGQAARRALSYSRQAPR